MNLNATEHLAGAQTNDRSASEANYWAYSLVMEHPRHFLPVLENQKPKGERSTAIERIFYDFGVPQRAKILDLSCGTGTHSINLAKKEYQVVGG